MKDTKTIILEEYTKGNIVCSGFEGISVYNLEEFIQQPLEGMLFDINRDEATILTLIEDPKWVNDYALTTILKKLYNENKELKERLNERIQIKY